MVTDDDLQALVSDEAQALEKETYKLVSLKVCSETGETPHADIVLTDQGAEKQAAADGGGPVDAAFKAIEAIVNSGARYRLKIADRPVLIRALVANVTNRFGWNVGENGGFTPNGTRRFTLSLSTDI